MTIRDGRILVVCTGNVCRSPYIERTLATALADTDIEVRSAGTGALVGHPVDPGSARLLAAAGLAWEDFAARSVTPEHVLGSDLIVGATRAHVAEVATVHPRALRRAMALADLAVLLDGVTPADIEAAHGDTWVAKVTALALSRRGTRSLRADADADVVDPFRRDDATFELMADQVARMLPPVVAALRG